MRARPRRRRREETEVPATTEETTDVTEVTTETIEVTDVKPEETTELQQQRRLSFPCSVPWHYISAGIRAETTLYEDEVGTVESTCALAISFAVSFSSLSPELQHHTPSRAAAHKIDHQRSSKKCTTRHEEVRGWVALVVKVMAHWESPSSPSASYFPLAIHATAWILQLIGHGVFERRKPALFDSLDQALITAPMFVLLEILFPLVTVRNSTRA
ncbi:uncharacterized protein PITG_20012 [Phytophthora infestans T30-4]|uniref:Transmembrane protein n=1 Tax=Phytophthora infestans (strain T30-4) TaxID=403677 RepID=D0P176_PHYIT|nr:uncharacterized protein PITG_20012 [Phytophthora infestans T30-4]EEY54099.1 hypothetical protein PITG_20012 [Phytophthora infestans T30-4]|eukprot:XP_002895951.1 hypothetical protein PITG_20012 [Phytophthora infestans T30-4]